MEVKDLCLSYLKLLLIHYWIVRKYSVLKSTLIRKAFYASKILLYIIYYD